MRDSRSFISNVLLLSEAIQGKVAIIGARILNHTHAALCIRFSRYQRHNFALQSYQVLFKALNTVLAFVSARKHLATTFPVVRSSVEGLLKQ